MGISSNATSDRLKVIDLENVLTAKLPIPNPWTFYMMWMEGFISQKYSLTFIPKYVLFFSFASFKRTKFFLLEILIKKILHLPYENQRELFFLGRFLLSWYTESHSESSSYFLRIRFIVMNPIFHRQWLSCPKMTNIVSSKKSNTKKTKTLTDVRFCQFMCKQFSSRFPNTVNDIQQLTA